MKRIIGIFICMLLLTTIFPVSAINTIYKPTNSTIFEDILYVGGSGPGNYSTIQDAINDASYGDKIFVYSGIYYENVKVFTSVILQGENKESTIIDGGGSGDTIYVTADNVEITGFSIRNSGVNWLEAGIELHFIEHCVIKDNIVSNCGYGIAPYVTSDVTISRNIVKDNGFGIRAQKTEGSEIKRNSIQNNDIGLEFNAVYYCDIVENNFIDNERHVFIYGALLNDVNRNYWDRFVSIGPKILFGFLTLFIPLPGFIVDWNPVDEPYEI